MKLCPKCQKQFSDDANFCPVDAARLVPLEAQAAGTDSLTVASSTWATGSAAVAPARSTARPTRRPARPCVVKLVAPAVVALPGVAQRLERELKQLERVQSAGVARVLASGKRGDENWVATELLDGAQTLAEAIAARGPIPHRAGRGPDRADRRGADRGRAGRRRPPRSRAEEHPVRRRRHQADQLLAAGADHRQGSRRRPSSSRPSRSTASPSISARTCTRLGALYYYVLTGQTVARGLARRGPQAHVSRPDQAAVAARRRCRRRSRP